MSTLTLSHNLDHVDSTEPSDFKPEPPTLSKHAGRVSSSPPPPTNNSHITPPSTPPVVIEDDLRMPEHHSNAARLEGGPEYIKGLKPFSSSSLESQPYPVLKAPGMPLSKLQHHLGGNEISPGLFYPAHSLTELLTEDEDARKHRLRHVGSTVNKTKPRPEKETWYALDPDTNPFVPAAPVSHS